MVKTQSHKICLECFLTDISTLIIDDYDYNRYDILEQIFIYINNVDRTKENDAKEYVNLLKDLESKIEAGLNKEEIMNDIQILLLKRSEIRKCKSNKFQKLFDSFGLNKPKSNTIATEPDS